MSKVDPKTIHKIAKLAAISLSPKEEGMYAKDLEKILSYVEQLNEVDTKDVEPIHHGFPLESSFREDEPLLLSEEETKEIVNCSGQRLYNQYQVPSILGEEA